VGAGSIKASLDAVIVVQLATTPNSGVGEANLRSHVLSGLIREELNNKSCVDYSIQPNGADEALHR
jgi:hypothetical protein